MRIRIYQINPERDARHSMFRSYDERYNITQLGENAELLKFTVGGKTGSAGPMRVEFFLDKAVSDNDSSTPADVAFDIEASDIPSHHSVHIGGYKMLTMRVTNMCGKENTLVRYDFSAE